MPSTQFQTINCDSRNTLIRNRDAIQDKYSIKMRFPKNLVRGGFQDMVLEGGPQAIFAAQKEINRILATWQSEYDQFLERKAKRALASRRSRNFFAAKELSSWPETSSVKTGEPVKTNKNKFHGLALDEEDKPSDGVEHLATVEEEFPALSGGGDGVGVMENKSVLTSWNKVVSAPAPSTSTTSGPSSTSTRSAPSPPKAFESNPGFSWGDENSDSEDGEDVGDGEGLCDWPTLTMREPYNFGNPGVHIEFGIHGEDYSEYDNFNSDDEDQWCGPPPNQEN